MIYDPETCQTAAELRANGIAVPDTIPDCGWIPRGSIVLTGEPIVELHGAEIRVRGLAAKFTVPFQWIEATVTVK